MHLIFGYEGVSGDEGGKREEWEESSVRPAGYKKKLTWGAAQQSQLSVFVDGQPGAQQFFRVPPLA